jgi:hypothetical protein
MPEETAPTQPTSTESVDTSTTVQATDVASEATPTDSTSTHTYEPSWFKALDEALNAEPAGSAATSEKTPEAEAPEAPEAEAPEAEAPEAAGDDEAVKNMSQNAGAKFKEIKAEAKAARARVAELESRLAELEGAAVPDKSSIEDLQQAIADKEAKLAEYEQELSISRFEATEEYKESVVAPMAAIIGVVEDLAKEYEVSEKMLLDALEEPNSRKQGELIADLASNFSERDRFTLYQLGDDYSAIMEQRDKLRSRAAEALTVREKQLNARLSAEKEASKAAWQKTASQVWDKLRDKVTVSDMAALEAKLVEEVKNSDFDTMPAEHKAFAAYSGSLLPEILKQNKSLSAELSELKLALKKYQSATPGAGSGAEAKSVSPDSSLGFLEALEARMAV